MRLNFRVDKGQQAFLFRVQIFEAMPNLTMQSGPARDQNILLLKSFFVKGRGEGYMRYMTNS